MENQDWVAEHGWDKIVAVVMNQLTSENWARCPQIFPGCQEILCHVAKVGKPKEVLISLSEHCEAFQDDVKYRYILPAIATSFECWGVSPASAKVWDWVLETLVSHLHALETPGESAAAILQKNQIQMSALLKGLLYLYLYVHFPNNV